MVRTQIYLDEREHRVLRGVSSETGESMSALIRYAIDDYLKNRHVTHSDRLDRLKKVRGVLKGADLKTFKKVRNEFDRAFHK